MSSEYDYGVIVTGHPGQTVNNNYFIQTVGGGSGPGGGGVNVYLRENQAAAQKIVETDVPEPDYQVTVTAQRAKQVALKLMMQATARLGQTIALPCISPKTATLIRGMIGNLRFRTTSTTYGAWRGGENKSTTETADIPITINKDTFVAYGSHDGDGGLVYLLLHEVAHTFKEMRDFNASQYAAFRSGAGKGLTSEAAKLAYEATPEFALNEARANTIARALANALNMPFKYEPRFSYAIC